MACGRLMLGAVTMSLFAADVRATPVTLMDQGIRVRAAGSASAAVYCPNGDSICSRVNDSYLVDEFLSDEGGMFSLIVPQGYVSAYAQSTFGYGGRASQSRSDSITMTSSFAARHVIGLNRWAPLIDPLAQAEIASSMEQWVDFSITEGPAAVDFRVRAQDFRILDITDAANPTELWSESDGLSGLLILPPGRTYRYVLGFENAISSSQLDPGTAEVFDSAYTLMGVTAIPESGTGLMLCLGLGLLGQRSARS